MNAARSVLVIAALVAPSVPAASQVPLQDGQGTAAVVEPGEPAALKRMLDTALDDERHAIATYRAVLKKFGERRPFSNIVHAERRHERALLAQYERLGFVSPHDRWAEHAFALPDSFAGACDAAVVAEIRNGALYDELIASVGDDTVKAVFERLRWASVERHLPAFRKHGNGWETIETEALSERQAVQRDAAYAARDALFGRLFAELSGAMAEGGPSAAIDVCAAHAPGIAKEVAAEHGLRIGRTSHRRRNPRNIPPVWAELILDDLPTQPVHRADRNGRLGVITPIVTAAACTRCHGTPDALAPGVTEALTDRYPGDRATGFREGDLRGWFWIEVPAPTD